MKKNTMIALAFVSIMTMGCAGPQPLVREVIPLEGGGYANLHYKDWGVNAHGGSVDKTLVTEYVLNGKTVSLKTETSHQVGTGQQAIVGAVSALPGAIAGTVVGVTRNAAMVQSTKIAADATKYAVDNQRSGSGPNVIVYTENNVDVEVDVDKTCKKEEDCF